MSDMRPTERLLEVLHEFVDRSGLWIHDSDLESQRSAIEAYQVIDELRRRGDTLVRREDLRRWGIDRLMIQGDDKAAFDRLENALGGKMA